MFKFLIITVIFIMISHLVALIKSENNLKASILSQSDLHQHWNSFKAKYGRNYSAKNEFKRKQIFNKTIARINELNAQYNQGLISYKSGLNIHSDKTSEEFMQFIASQNLIVPVANSQVNNSYNLNDLKIPNSIDWRSKNNVVNPIKNQGNCGSCWAFSAVGSLESIYAIQTGNLLDLSEQNIVDCAVASGSDGCQGGWMSWAFDYIYRNNGIATQASYAYLNRFKSEQCKYKPNYSAGIYVKSYAQISGEESLQAAIAAIGPISVALQVTAKFQFYQSGIFFDDTCIGNVNHAVVAVGYGTDAISGKDYYILRNSWGTSWGTNGYALFARNQNNMCSISSYATYPILGSGPNIIKNLVSSASKLLVSNNYYIFLIFFFFIYLM